MLFDEIINIENLLLSWFEFRKGKCQKQDVQIFERNLEDNLFKLHWELKNDFYHHQPYESFIIHDPKLRHIHKARVRDRIVHHAVFRILYPLFNRYMIFDSYSCRLGKGTHKAVDRLKLFLKNISRNYQRPCFVLKCDIKQFFASVNHQILKMLLARRITDTQTINLSSIIIDSFMTLENRCKNVRGGAR